MQALHPAERQEINNAEQSSPKDHHHISDYRNNPINIYTFVLINPDDPAKKVNNHWH